MACLYLTEMLTNTIKLKNVVIAYLLVEIELILSTSSINEPTSQAAKTENFLITISQVVSLVTLILF